MIVAYRNGVPLVSKTDSKSLSISDDWRKSKKKTSLPWQYYCLGSVLIWSTDGTLALIELY